MAEEIRKALEKKRGEHVQGGAGFGSPPVTILRRRQVEQRTGLGRSSIYDYISKGQFPPPILIGDRAVRWIEAEIDGWLAAQVERSRKSA